MTGKGNKQKAAVKSKDGELLKSKEGRFARWKEHFKKVLNKEISESPPQEEQEQRTEKEARYFCRDTLNTNKKKELH